MKKRFFVFSLLLLVLLISSTLLAAEKKIVVYFPNWGVYQETRNNAQVGDIPWDKVTVVNHAFFTVDSNFELKSTDEYADFEASYQHSEGWEPGALRGHFAEYKYYKTQYPDVKLLVSVGGWTRGENFHDMALTPEGRATFINSCIEFLKEYPFIDGIDIDWEYPGVDRPGDPNDEYDRGCPGGPEDKENFTKLLKEFRQAYQRNGLRDKMLTIANSANYSIIDGNQEPHKYYQYLDYINIMTYDMHGAFGNMTNHHSAIYSSPYDQAAVTPVDQRRFNVDDAVKFYRDEYGIPAEKLVVGSPFYSRGWKNVNDQTGNNGLYAEADGGAPGIWDNPSVPAGQNPYWRMKELEQTSGYKKYRDEYAKVPYLYNESKGLFYTYEDEKSLAERCNYVNQNELGGIVAWEITGDDPDNDYPLTSLIYNKFNSSIEDPAPPEEPSPEPTPDEPDPEPDPPETDPAPVESGYKVVGYLPTWSGEAEDIQYENLSHINYSFLIPTSEGNIRPLENTGKLQEVVSQAHSLGVKVLIAVGGWSYNGTPLDNTFEELASSKLTRENFVDNIMTIVDKYNLDGVDLDWEFPDPPLENNGSADNFLSLIKLLHERLQPQGKLLTIAVHAGATPFGNDDYYWAYGVKEEVFDYVNFVNIMAYDGGDGEYHSPYSLAEKSLNYWVNIRGLDKEKAILGVPFYGRPGWDAYKDIVARDADAPYKDVSDGTYYNGIDTIKEKTKLAVNQGGGVMIWELSQDTSDSTSLLKAIGEEISVQPSPPIDPVDPEDPIDPEEPEEPEEPEDPVDPEDPDEDENPDYPVWDAGSVYTNGDSVAYDGQLWEAKWWTLGEEPGTTGEWGVWKSIEEHSTDPEDPEEPENPEDNEYPVWNADDVYTKGDIVAYDGQLWEAKWWTLGEEPGTTGEWGVWRALK